MDKEIKLRARAEGLAVMKFFNYGQVGRGFSLDIPFHRTHSLKLIAKEEQELPKEAEIYLRGKPINQLTKTYIIIWNSGKAIIKGEDIVKDNPPTITFEEGSEILNTYAKATRDTSKFTATLLDRAPHTLICNFDYLEPGDGAAIEILHTSALRKPTIQGAIRGIPKGILNYGEVQPYKQANPPISLALHFFVTIFCVFMAYTELTKPPHERLIVTTLLPLLGSTFSLASLIYLIIQAKSRNNPNRPLTKLLRTFKTSRTPSSKRVGRSTHHRNRQSGSIRTN